MRYGQVHFTRARARTHIPPRGYPSPRADSCGINLETLFQTPVKVLGEQGPQKKGLAAGCILAPVPLGPLLRVFYGIKGGC